MGDDDIGRIYGILSDLKVKNMELSTKLDTVSSTVKELSGKVDLMRISGCAKGASHDDIETRVRALEKQAWYMAGGGAVLGVFGSFILSKIGVL